MKPKIHNILQDCIETGIRYGFRKAKKHSEDPTDEVVGQEIDRAIWYELNEKFEFETQEQPYENEIDYWKTGIMAKSWVFNHSDSSIEQVGLL